MNKIDNELLTAIAEQVRIREPSFHPTSQRFKRLLPSGPSGLTTTDQPNRHTRATREYLLEASLERRRTLEELRTLIYAIRSGITDEWQLTDLIFYARHPDIIGRPLTTQPLLDEWNAISALLVHPTLNMPEWNSNAHVNEGLDIVPSGSVLRRPNILPDQTVNRSTQFDEAINCSVQLCPGLSNEMLRSLLWQESRFKPSVVNQYGYAGIAQIGRAEAAEVGLNVGVPGTKSDERLDPFKSIPAAARLLNSKATRLNQTAFTRYGQPSGMEFWKFVLAAYNGGEGTITLAKGHAYRFGLSLARSQGLVGNMAVSFAKEYSSQWENLIKGGMESPLGRAVSRYFGELASSKYVEIANFPKSIVNRMHASP